MDQDHEYPDSLCLSRVHSPDPVLETLRECYQAAERLLEDFAVPQLAFFATRHLAELCLKALDENPQRGHDLDKLLRRLEEQGHDLLSRGEPQRTITAFIRDLHAVDPGGDEGRYATTTKKVPSLAEVCCGRQELLVKYVNQLYIYTVTHANFGPEGTTTA
ncbi:hypothetical protein ACIRQY_33565 [Streptomyces sp. NPDC101490]|uniref:hypothetical protein n=1 Tax=Streptomyces sp. NPDC101490 TaxID=3366143 RepID=UPI0037F1602A